MSREAEGAAGAVDGADQGRERRPAWLGWPPPEKAYQLHLRGLSSRAIARELGIDPKTAQKWVREVAKAAAPLIAEKREASLRAAVARFRNVQEAAWAEWDSRGEAQLLNTIATCEREVARLRGLYAADAAAGGSVDGGLQVTIRYVDDWRGRAVVAVERAAGDAGETPDEGGAE